MWSKVLRRSQFVPIHLGKPCECLSTPQVGTIDEAAATHKAFENDDFMLLF